MKRIGRFIKSIWWDDPYEQTATVAFGIGLPVVLLIFIGILWILK